MSSLSLHAAASLNSALSPRLQRAVRLLQMSSLDFAQIVRGAVDTNPFLESEDGGDAGDAGAAGEDASEAAGESGWTGEVGWGVEAPSRIRHVDGEGEGGAFDSMQAQTSLADHLLGQIHVMPLTLRDCAIAEALIGCLDDDGYLRCPLQDVVASCGVEPCPDEDELSIALRRVQALDPAGVGARDVRECLSLQLQVIAYPELRALTQVMLRDHFDALVTRDMRALVRRTGSSAAAVEAAYAALRRLDPHPGWRYSPPPTAYITPDILARKVRGRWKAMLNEAVVPRIKLNRGYVDLFQQHRNSEHAALGEHLQEARWTVRNVEQRFSTILSVAHAILERQQHFLDYGPMAMKPLSLREIAEVVGVHESTVSRVTNNKFMATPCGVFELKYFFSRGLSTAAGSECSPTAVRGLIQEMIEAEPAHEPLSDVDIARELDKQGLKVARRTVTKYRQLLKIEPAERRRHAGHAG